MAFCPNCGQQLPENANHCPACGTAVAAFTQAQPAQETAPVQPAPQTVPEQPTPEQPAPQPVQWAPQQNPQQPAQQQPYQQAPQQPAAPVDPDVAANKSIAWLSYLGIFLLIPMFSRKTSAYCRHHVTQGFTLCAIEIAYMVCTQVLLGIIYAIFPPVLTWFGSHNSTVYTIFYWIFFVGNLFLIAVAVIGIIAAATGKKDKLFVFGKVPFIEKLVKPVIDMAYDAMNKQK